MQINNSTSPKTWAIKLGSVGVCVPFCEKHKIVGIGWEMVDAKIIRGKSYEEIRKYISGISGLFTDDKRRVGSDTGNIFRFTHECKIGDYILYYDPPKKHVRICRVTSEPLYRNFDPAQKDIDIWHYRKVEYPVAPISILDFDGRLKGGLLGPRMSFWKISEDSEAVEENIKGNSSGKADQKISDAYNSLNELLINKSLLLTAEDWELVVADYLEAQGAHVRGKVGGNQPIIDVEATFNRGELGIEVWRGQVKYYRSQKVDWPEIERDFNVAGENVKFFFASVAGFTEEAISKASDEGIRLFEAGDFTKFFLSGKLNERLRRKLGLGAFVGSVGSGLHI